jgi:hypothetical protein
MIRDKALWVESSSGAEGCDPIRRKDESEVLEQKHNYSRKPVPTPGSSPGAGFFGIML